MTNKIWDVATQSPGKNTSLSLAIIYIIVLVCKAFREMRLSCIDTLMSLTRVLVEFRVTDRNSIFRRTAT